MAAPTFQVNEYNTSGQTLSAAVPQIAFAAVDQASSGTLSTTFPIANNAYSYEKWNKWQCLTVAPNGITSYGVYFSSTAPTDSGSSSANVTIKFAVNSSFATPVASASAVATTLCSSDTTAGSATAFTGPANSANAVSTSFLVQQFFFATAAAGGNAIFPSPWAFLQYTWSSFAGIGILAATFLHALSTLNLA